MADTREKGNTGDKDQEAANNAHAGGTEARIVKWLDVGSKLAGAIAAVIVVFIANSYQQSQTVAALLSKREEADSNLRAAMFHDMIDPVIGAKASSDRSSPERAALLVELLALNFHENIELKPLMVDIDRRLKRDIGRARKLGNKEDAKDLEDRREELRSIARRVRTRQTMMLTQRPNKNEGKNAGATFGSQPRGGELKFFVVSKAGVVPVEGGPCGAPAEYGTNVGEKDLVITDSPDRKKSLFMSIEPQSWVDEIFTVHVVVGDKFAAPSGPADGTAGERAASSKVKDADGKSETNPQLKFSGWEQTFDITWFDFPLSDNSQLADGTRFSFFVDDVCPAGQKKENGIARIGLLWFPPDYFPSRERPTNYQAFKETLHLR